MSVGCADGWWGRHPHSLESRGGCGWWGRHPCSLATCACHAPCLATRACCAAGLVSRAAAAPPAETRCARRPAGHCCRPGRCPACCRCLREAASGTVTVLAGARPRLAAACPAADHPCCPAHQVNASAVAARRCWRRRGCSAARGAAQALPAQHAAATAPRHPCAPCWAQAGGWERNWSGSRLNTSRRWAWRWYDGF